MLTGVHCGLTSGLGQSSRPEAQERSAGRQTGPEAQGEGGGQTEGGRQAEGNGRGRGRGGGAGRAEAVSAQGRQTSQVGLRQQQQ